MARSEVRGPRIANGEDGEVRGTRTSNSERRATSREQRAVSRREAYCCEANTTIAFRASRALGFTNSSRTLDFTSAYWTPVFTDDRSCGPEPAGEFMETLSDSSSVDSTENRTDRRRRPVDRADRIPRIGHSNGGGGPNAGRRRRGERNTFLYRPAGTLFCCLRG